MSRFCNRHCSMLTSHTGLSDYRLPVATPRMTFVTRRSTM
jgi:hypothetical protein